MLRLVFLGDLVFKMCYKDKKGRFGHWVSSLICRFQGLSSYLEASESGELIYVTERPLMGGKVSFNFDG